MTKLTEKQKAERALKRQRGRALAAETEHERHAAKHREWELNGIRLSREEFEAGVHCRGCGLPVVDGLGDWPAVIHRTPEQQAKYDRAEADYRSRHGDCHASRWSMSGSRTTHCSYCCPPPPLSTAQVDRITTLLSRGPDPRELASWRLTLTCEHTIERTQHRPHRSWSGMGVVRCAACVRDRGIVTAEYTGPVATEAADSAPRHSAPTNKDAHDLVAAKRALTKMLKESERLKVHIAALERGEHDE